MILFLVALMSNTSMADQYTDAIAAAQHAAMIQSGLQGYQDKLQTYGNDQGMRYINKAGLAPEAGIIGGAYYLYKNHKIPLHYKNCKLTIYQDHVDASIENFSFSASQTNFSASIKLDSLWRLVE